MSQLYLLLLHVHLKALFYNFDYRNLWQAEV